MNWIKNAQHNFPASDDNMIWYDVVVRDVTYNSGIINFPLLIELYKLFINLSLMYFIFIAINSTFKKVREYIFILKIQHWLTRRLVVLSKSSSNFFFNLLNLCSRQQNEKLFNCMEINFIDLLSFLLSFSSV